MANENKAMLTYAGLKKYEDEQSEIERRIDELERILKHAEVVVDDDIDTGKINVGCEISLYDMEYDEEVTYQLVGSSEANSLKGKISNESPVGAALMGHHVGDLVNVDLPSGASVQYKVLSIKKID